MSDTYLSIDDLMTHTQRQSRFAVILAFGLVYFFWGSTYLAIDIAVERIPPALMCGIRFLTAGVFMLAFCGLRGRNIWYNPRQLGHMATVGVLLLMGGNLTLSYAEKYVASGLAALIVAVTPLWFLVLDTLLLGDHHVSVRGKAGLGLGVAGLAVLLWPDVTTTTSFGRVQLWASISLLGGSFSWALGSVLAKRWKSADVDPFSATAWQMIAAGLANLLLAMAKRDFSQVLWTPRGVGATVYLIVCGSWIGYTAYIYLLNHVPTAKVSTYAYVNPVVAVFLGWLILHERVDGYILVGSAIVVASVILVTSAQVTKKSPTEEMAIMETTGD
ncbi:MAG TPA: EamA family transporter [Terriglobales bacterium]|nr:EamA family transporter [Terriglobales bacterium]